MLIQIDHIDNEIAKFERTLNMLRAQEAAKAQGYTQVEVSASVTVSKSFVPESLLDDYTPRQMAHSSELLAEKELIWKIICENRKYVKNIRGRQQERDSYLYFPETPGPVPVPTLDPSLITKSISVDPKIRSVLVERIRTKQAVIKYRESLLRDRYEYLHDKWQLKVKKLTLKANMKASEIHQSPSKTNLLEDSYNSRTSRRTGFADGVVRSEAEWQDALQLLGFTTEEQEARIRERCVKEPDMISDRSLAYADTNNLVLDPAADLAAFNEQMDLKWSEHEKDEFKRNLIVFDKNFNKLATFLPRKSTQDCVQYFYREKINLRFKQLIRRSMQGQGRGRRRKEKPESGRVPELFRSYLLHDSEEVVYLPRIYEEGDASAQESDAVPQDDAGDVPLDEHPGWSSEEVAKAQRGLELVGRDYAAISALLEDKTEEQCRLFFEADRRKKTTKPNGPGRKPKKRGPKPKTPLSASPSFKKMSELQDGFDFGALDSDSAQVVLKDEKKRKGDDNVEKKARKKKKSEVPDIPEVVDPALVGTPQDPALQRKTISYWSVAERAEFIKQFTLLGKNWEAISRSLGTKSTIQVRNYYHNSRHKLKLDLIPVEASSSKAGKKVAQKDGLKFHQSYDDFAQNQSTPIPALPSLQNLISVTQHVYNNYHADSSIDQSRMNYSIESPYPASPLTAPPVSSDEINSFRAASSYMDQVRIAQQADLLTRAQSQSNLNVLPPFGSQPLRSFTSSPLPPMAHISPVQHSSEVDFQDNQLKPIDLAKIRSDLSSASMYTEILGASHDMTSNDFDSSSVMQPGPELPPIKLVNSRSPSIHITAGGNSNVPAVTTDDAATDATEAQRGEIIQEASAGIEKPVA
jgi:Myb-like DNA-binding domain